MFLFAHVGITLGAAVAGSAVVHIIKDTVGHKLKPKKADDAPDLLREKDIHRVSMWVKTLARFMDLRFLILGSILPDIIDKPIGMFLFGGGRIFTHSLLVSGLLTIIAVYIYLKYRRTWMLAIAAGMLSHLVLDSMWLSPHIFYWPSDGWTFPVGVRTNYLDRWLDTLIHDPEVIITEAIGFLICLAATGYLIMIKKFKSFFIYGKL